MEETRPNLANDLRLKQAILTSNIIERNEISQPVYFVICNSCYWCATYFRNDDLGFRSESSSHNLNCPICNSQNIELMPIAIDESFRIEYSLTRGMEMEFYKTHRRQFAKDLQTS
jgi:hypothetical protein